ncbi:hypothetical protein ASPZODRAFT_135026 [Penicilliopsis zonata CBS 506.65]|uniref:Autophagy-related protein 29 n=1 Tax=Penicilliopsis zonata CBS 506.65 TaxID=1073090 RepID=A0A1L9SAV0_9EURO|nr:hypothetical protein ASPZODRAFT_135026 [Penicilliopsis zonata CBS 506.65]OJJ44239.1 hypothetical protein ASPZODRAFT_135026 [Penicilliopsis zonata CBS 506.65]
MAAASQHGNVNYTVFIRLPIPRGDFVDPPPIEWNVAKDQALWDILSRPSKGDDVDWKALADNFDVTLQFLLQQAAWLYDQQLSKVRAQMRKVGSTQPNAPSPTGGSVSGSTALGGQPAKGTLSSGQRVSSRLASYQKEASSQRAAGIHRTSSTSTVNQLRGTRETSRNNTPTVEVADPKWESAGRRPSATRREQAAVAQFHRSPTLEEEDLSSSSSSKESSSDSENEISGRRGARFKRFGKFSIHRPGLRDDQDDDVDESPAFLPMTYEPTPSGRESLGQDPNATLRLEAQRPPIHKRRTADRPPPPLHKSTTADSSTSSVSSGVPVSHPRGDHPRRTNQIAGVPSPRRTAELSRLSSRRSVASGRDVSDDTPSMGSSFSDLDDASVTQSALEEALMSNMQHGGMASRMSTISQALRSRYL